MSVVDAVADRLPFPTAPATRAAVRAGSDWNIYPRLAGGCHAARDTETAIRGAGFTVERIRRFEIRGGPVRVPHILGRAR